MSPIRVADTLARIDACIRNAMSAHTDDEQRRAAEALGLGEWLPEPQQELELRR